MNPGVTAVVVCYGQAAASRRAIESLRGQTHPPAEILVVDNDPAASTAKALARAQEIETVRCIHTGFNLGYTRAANLAAAQARGDWLFFLNPDAIAEPTCLRELLAAAEEVEGIGVLGAQILLPDGRVNAGENPLSIVGISWSGGYGSPREHGRARDVAAVSGAALLVDRAAFLSIGGLCPHFFMYVDDTDLAWRMRLSGRRVRFCPAAAVVHDYGFAKGPHKWFYLERNRHAALLSNLSLRTLILLAPLLAVTELAVLAHAVSNGWLKQKLRAWIALASMLPALRGWRHTVQSSRTVSDYRVLEKFTGAIRSDLLDSDLPACGNLALDGYRALLLAVLRRIDGEPTAKSETFAPAS